MVGIIRKKGFVFLLSPAVVVVAATLCLYPVMPQAQEQAQQQAQPQQESVPSIPSSPVEYADWKLEKAGMPKSMIRLLKKGYDDELASRVVILNVLGFLGNADYSGHYSPETLKKCRAFIRKHHKSLKAAEARYGVPKETIAALLWVETKHGRTLGKLPVGAVYYSLVQADHPARIKEVSEDAKVRAPASIPGPELQSKIEARSAQKASWALDQIVALSKIHQLGRKRLSELRGSYAGAFGIPQFIPTSYLSWGKSSFRVRNPDLFKPSDAIESVAFYLKSQGWDKNSPESWVSALFHYNRAKGYGEVILRIAKDLGLKNASSMS